VLTWGTDSDLLSETSMGAIPFGSVTELRYGSDVWLCFFPVNLFAMRAAPPAWSTAAA
jgi:hypothetical protein